MTINTEEFLTGSTNGLPILISAISSPGTIIHTTPTSTNSKDNIMLYAQNLSTNTVTLTIEYGDSTATNQIIQGIVGQQGLILILPGLPLNNGTVVKAFSSVANVINIVGFINRRTD